MRQLTTFWQQLRALPWWTRGAIVGGCALMAILVVIAGLALAKDGSDDNEVELRRPTAERAAVTPTTISSVLAAPTPSPLADRTDCDAMRGTDYRSPAERTWFLANCVTSVAVQVAIPATPAEVPPLPQKVAPATLPPLPPMPTFAPLPAPSPQQRSDEVMTLLINWLVGQGAEPSCFATCVLFLPNDLVPGSIFAYRLWLDTCTTTWLGYSWMIVCDATDDHCAAAFAAGQVCRGDPNTLLAWMLSETSLLVTWHF